MNRVVDLEVRRIAAELETFPYVARSWTDTVKLDGNAAGGHADIVAGCGGAAVYHDIIAEGGRGTRAVVKRIADRLIVGLEARTTSERNTAAAIEEVAKLRSLGRAHSKPELPPDAGLYYVPTYAGVPPVLEPCVLGANVARLLGAKVARYLRRHATRPFGPRGVTWMIQAAREAWRSALLDGRRKQC